MEYNTFINELKTHILSSSKWNLSKQHYMFLQDGYTSEDIEELDFIRNTNIKYHQVESDILIGDFIEIKFDKESGNSICRFDAKYLFKEFSAGGWDRIDYIITENIKIATDVSINQITDNLNDFNFIRERLIIRPINYTDNKYELKNALYQLHGDIALVLYILLYDNTEVGLGSMKVPKKILEVWEKELSEVWEEALVNTYVIAPPRMYLNQTDVENPPYTKGAFMALNSPIKQIGKLYPPVVTTTRKKNGAIAMFYPGVFEKIAELCNGSYYIAFTSIDDVRIHPENTLTPRRILQSLKDVNKMFNKREDILSRKVFFYNKEKGILEALEL